MIYLILSILLNTVIFTLFKLFGRLDINTFQTIVVNYFVCVITGASFAGPAKVLAYSGSSAWVYIALALGIVFISTFYLMALTAQKISMAASSIASKLSLIMPVMFSLLILNTASSFTYINYAGVLLALLATWFSAKDHSGDGRELQKIWYLPVLVFLGNGIIDITINFVNVNLLNKDTLPVFPVYVFLSAAVIGGLILLFSYVKLKRSSVLGGLFLGIVNYFSVYYILQALDHLHNNGAQVFPIFNTGIILGSALVGILFFKEKLSRINKLGIAIAVVSILLVMV